MKNITERQLQILEHLAEFKFLTTTQLTGLLGVKTITSINVLLKKLSDGKGALTRSKDFGFYPGFGRLPRIHFLSTKGAGFLAENLELEREKIKVPKENKLMFQRDYFHRVASVDFNIGLSKYCKLKGFNKVFFDYYFDMNGSQRNGDGKAKNALPVGELQIIPDGVGKVSTQKGDTVFLFEQHNGKDTKRAVQQIFNHMQAIAEMSANKKYNHQKSVRVLYIFESGSCKKAVVRELYKRQDITSFKDYFLFKTQEQLQENFNENWLLFNGEYVSFI
ncbi:MAG: replication-relaxation family protein [Colwellia sp.]|jgi:hypothetical protein